MPAESNSQYDVEMPELNDDLAILSDEPKGSDAQGKASRAGTQDPGTQTDDDLVSEDEKLIESEEKPEPKVDEKEDDEEEKEEKAKPEEEDDATLPLSKRLEKISPGILKKVPGLRQVLYREEQFTSHFATPEDAKDAVEHLSSLEPIEVGLLQGSAGELLESLNNTNPKLMERVAMDFLPKLYERDQQTFFKVVDPVVRRLLTSAFSTGQKTQNKNLEAAARWMSQFVYNSFDIPQETPTKSEPNPEAEQFQRERQEFHRQRFEAHRGEILSGSVGTMITAVTKQIDPEGKLTPFMKDKLSESVMVELDRVLSQDTRHMNVMASMWRRATKANFTPEWKSRIQNAYLLRARQALPSALAKVRREAGLGEPKAVQRTGQAQPQRRNITPSASARPVSERISGPVDPRTVDYGATSDMDILNDRITKRK